MKLGILIGGLLIMLLMAIYPPWVYQDSSGKQVPMGYSFIWAPPEQKIDKKGNLFGFKFDLEVRVMKGNSLDIWKLLAQEAMAAAITFGAVIVAGKTESENSAPKEENG